MCGRLRLFWGTVVVVGLTACSFLYADAFGVPRSNLVVEGQIRLANGFSAHFYSREGTMLTIRDLEEGQWYGFVPVVSSGPNKVNFASYVITPTPSGGESVVEVESGVDIQKDSTNRFSFPDGGAVEIQVLGVRPGKFSKAVLVDPRSRQPRELQKLYGAVGGGLCVLSCGGVTVGANSVQVECGSCQGAGIDF